MTILMKSLVKSEFLFSLFHVHHNSYFVKRKKIVTVHRKRERLDLKKEVKKIEESNKTLY